MALNKKRQPTLHELHADASTAGQQALDVFYSVADSLSVAAAQHSDVADRAQAQVDELVALRDSALAAAGDATRQAEAVRGLVG